MSPDDHDDHDDHDDLGDALRGAFGHDPDRVPSASGVDRIRALAQENSSVARADGVTPISSAPSRSTTSRRQWMLGAVAAGAGLVVGSAATIGVRGDGGDDSRAEGLDPAVTEDIVFVATQDVAAGTISRSALVNHSWGGELVLDISDLPAGGRYDVAYTDRDGSTLTAGSFLAVGDVVMRCRFNSALLRADTARIDISTSTGEVVATAELA